MKTGQRHTGPTETTIKKILSQKFGMLLAVRIIPAPPYEATRVECLCDCGGISAPTARALLIGNTKSCGCMKRNVLGNATRVHGKTKTTVYAVWVNMRRRCYDPSVNNFHRYGGRGIAVCKEWRDSFVCFYEDMGDPPIGMSLERINNDGDYCKSNCRWATRLEQGNNTIRNRKLSWKGECLSLAEWSRRLDCSTNTLQARLRKNWDAEKTLATPILTGKRSFAPALVKGGMREWP